jgi:hypothetical protein
LSKRAVEQDQLRREAVDVVVDGLERVLGRIDHEAEHQRGHHHEEVGGKPHHGTGVILAVLGGKALMDRQADQRGPGQTSKDS